MFTIRKASKEDALFIRRLIRQVGINPMSLDWERFVIAVQEDGERIGCTQLKIHSDQSRELASVAVVPAYRKQGVADAMIREVLSGQTGPVYLTCRGSLVPFYERYDFAELVEIEAMPAYFRKVKKVFNWLEKRKWVEHLAVMVRND